MGTYNFKEDLRNAKLVEKELAEYLIKETHPTCSEVIFNNDNKWDIQLILNDSTSVTYEVKDDHYSFKSGNVAVEFECRGKPSGISVTQADFWVTKVYLKPNKESKWVVWKTSDLKESCKTYPIKVGGDWKSNTKMYIIPLNEFMPKGETRDGRRDKEEVLTP